MSETIHARGLSDSFRYTVFRQAIFHGPIFRQHVYLSVTVPICLGALWSILEDYSSDPIATCRKRSEDDGLRFPTTTS